MPPRYRPAPPGEGDAQRDGRDGEREESECQQTLAPNDPSAPGSLTLASRLARV